MADVIAKYGQPSSRTTSSSGSAARVAQSSLPSGLQPAPISGTFETLAYSYQRTSTLSLLVGRIDSQGRTLTLSFWNDRLIYYGFNSSFQNDTTNFDEKRISSFVRGQTTRADIVRDLGSPSGEGVYPYVATEGTSMISYQYVASAGSPIVITIKRAQFLFDRSDRLIDTYIAASTIGSQPGS